MPFDLGDTVRLEAECRDADGTLATAAAATLTLTLPDGTTSSPTVDAPATAGQYTHDYVTTQAGRHAVRWVFTGPACAYTDSFDVREAEPPTILSLADAKQHLNITGTTDDDELRGWIEATTAAVEWFVGPVVQRTVTEVHSRRTSASLALHQPPVVSLTTLAAVRTGGTSYVAADMDVDSATGIVTRLDGGSISGPLRVTYTAGRAVVPASITAAARIILQHLWRTQRAGSRGPVFGGGDDFSVTEPIPGLGYAVPNRAVQLLDPYRLSPGVA